MQNESWGLRYEVTSIPAEFAKWEAIFDDDKLQTIIDEFLIHLQTKLGGDKKLKDAKQFCRTFRKQLYDFLSFHKNAGEWKQLALEVVIRKILFYRSTAFQFAAETLISTVRIRRQKYIAFSRKPFILGLMQ